MEYTVHVTGFGPFVGHEQINASWEAVKLLPNKIEVNNILFQIKKIEVPVIYDEVDSAIKRIWGENPKLVIHCGVCNPEAHIILEKFSYNRNFCRPDFAKKVLKCNRAVLVNNKESCEFLQTNFKLDDFVQDLNSERELLKVSSDPGEYLCSYIYLKSLDMDHRRSLFIHVPPINRPYTSHETKDAIFNVIKKCLEQLFEEKLI